MKETQFIRQNKEKWVELESLHRQGKPDPDRMTDLFIHLNDDLSYARTFYPNRSIRLYLNQLAQRSFQHLYRTQRFSWPALVQFWRYDLPLVLFRQRYAMLLSLFVFVLSLVIGIVSSLHLPDFARQVLGDRYVDMTLTNIAADDPMAVYKDAQPLDMFLGITLNNVMVSFRVFLFGLLASIGTLGLLLYNGILVGTFQFFFIERGLFWDSFLTIWLHGTLEISAIIIAGGAGLVLGKGLLFPGTYSRWQAFLLTARDGFRILMGTVPLFILAAFIEGYFTRYTTAPDGIRLFLIVTCALAVLLYFVVLPIRLHYLGLTPPAPLPLAPPQPPEWNPREIHTNGTLYMHTFLRFRGGWSRFVRTAGGATAATFLLLWAFYPEWWQPFADVGELWSGFVQLSNWLYSRSWWELLPVAGLAWLWQGRQVLRTWHVPVNTRRTWLGLTLSAAIAVAPLMGGWGWHWILLLLSWPLAGMVLGVLALEETGALLPRALQLLGLQTGKWLGLYSMLLLTGAIVLLLTNSPLQLLLAEVVSWNLTADQAIASQVVVASTALFTWFTWWLLVPLLQLSFTLQAFTLREIREAPGLNKELDALVR